MPDDELKINQICRVLFYDEARQQPRYCDRPITYEVGLRGYGPSWGVCDEHARVYLDNDTAYDCFPVGTYQAKRLAELTKDEAQP